MPNNEPRSATPSRDSRPQQRRRVLLRTHDDEPRVAVAHWRDSGYIFVAKEDTDAIVGFPAGRVYEFDESIVSQLKTAYETGNWQSLENLWSDADVAEAHMETRNE